MRVVCETHGEVEVEPWGEGVVCCPECLCAEVAATIPDGGMVLMRKDGYPIAAFPYIPEEPDYA